MVYLPADLIEGANCGSCTRRQPWRGVVLPLVLVEVAQNAQSLSFWTKRYLLVGFAQVQGAAQPILSSGNLIDRSFQAGGFALS